MRMYTCHTCVIVVSFTEFHHITTMDDPSGWSLTESDPQVFSELLRQLGVKGLQVVSLACL